MNFLVDMEVLVLFYNNYIGLELRRFGIIIVKYFVNYLYKKKMYCMLICFLRDVVVEF